MILDLHAWVGGTYGNEVTCPPNRHRHIASYIYIKTSVIRFYYHFCFFQCLSVRRRQRMVMVMVLMLCFCRCFVFIFSGEAKRRFPFSYRLVAHSYSVLFGPGWFELNYKSTTCVWFFIIPMLVAWVRAAKKKYKKLCGIVEQESGLLLHANTYRLAAGNANERTHKITKFCVGADVGLEKPCV